MNQSLWSQKDYFLPLKDNLQEIIFSICKQFELQNMVLNRVNNEFFEVETKRCWVVLTPDSNLFRQPGLWEGKFYFFVWPYNS